VRLPFGFVTLGIAFCAKRPMRHVHTEHRLCVAKLFREVLRSSGIQCMVHTWQALEMCQQATVSVCASEKGEPVVRWGRKA